MGKLKLNDRLIGNVNTWGNVEYNVPMRSSCFETRSSTNVAHRFIPNIYTTLDCGVGTPLPDRVSGRDKVVEKEGYKTTSSEYCVKASYNKANEKSDKGINCKKVLFMTGVERQLMNTSIRQPVIQSETQERFRGEVRPETLSSPLPPDPEYIFDVVASGRNEVPVIPETSSNGFRRLLDPYLTTHRLNYRPYTAEDQYGVGAKDHITYYSESKTPKARGFGPKLKEIWMPLQATRMHPVCDKKPFKTEYKGIAARNVTDWVKGVFKSEMKTKYLTPYAISPLVTANHDEIWPLPPFRPNIWQDNSPPSMYCTEYCHIAQGTRVSTVVDQMRKQRIQEPCKIGLIVSKGL